MRALSACNKHVDCRRTEREPPGACPVARSQKHWHIFGSTRRSLFVPSVRSFCFFLCFALTSAVDARVHTHMHAVPFASVAVAERKRSTAITSVAPNVIIIVPKKGKWVETLQSERFPSTAERSLSQQPSKRDNKRENRSR